MKSLVALLLLIACLALPAAAQDTVHARIKTSLGDIDLALDAARAPTTTENFLAYATSGFYDRLIVHRVVPGVLIQGGGYNAAGYPRATLPPIVNESANGLLNERGTIAMARQDDPDSADSQWFINLKDNALLDRSGDLRAQAGYAVFGKVVAGLAVADAIGAVATGPGPDDSPFASEFPLEPVIVYRVDPIQASEVGMTQGDSGARTAQ